MLSDFQLRRGGVFSRIVGLSMLVALMFIGGCTTSSTVTIGPPAKLAFAVQPGNVGANGSFMVAVSIEDANGHVVTTATNPVTITIATNPGSGALAGTLTATPVNGVATFSNLTINSVGTNYTLAVTSTGLAGTTSSAFSVVGAPAKLAFTAQPSNVVAGSSITPGVTVSIEDQAGNVVPTATNPLTIAIGTNPSSGALSGTAQANAVAGVATFSNLSINKVGTGYTLAASATGLTAATSSTFNVTAGAAAKLAFTVQPGNTAAGAAISPAVQVTVEDSQGNTVATATNIITMGVSGGAQVTGTTAVAAANGVATFSNLLIGLAGNNYTLSANATGLTGATSGTFNVLVGAAFKLVFTGEPSNVAAGGSINPAVAVSVQDNSGNVVPTATNQITISIGTNPSSGTLSGTLQANAVAGVATFSNLSINKPGAGYTLTNSATGLAGTTSTAFTVAAGSASKLVFTTQPSNATAGAAIAPAVQVTIEDSLGNVVTSATNQVTMAIGANPSSGTLGGTAQAAAVAGIATFSNLSINNAGTGYTLGASATGLTGTTSNAFNIVAGAASKLVFSTQPTSATAGGAISPAVQVTVEDNQGNTVTTATNQITVSLGANPGNGTLSGTAQANAVAGVATFSTLSINAAGNGYTLGASATGLAGATSSAFNITAGLAAKLAFTTQPMNTVASSNIAPAVTVSVEDSLGNVVTSAANQITIAIGTNPASGSLSGTVTANAVNGVATFSTLDINNVGTGYTLTASAAGLTPATSAAFNIIVSVGPPAKLAFTVQPGNVAAGSSISPAVQVSVEDSNGNLVSGATNQVTIAIGTNPSSGTLAGTMTANAVSGVATFSTLSINKSGNGYTLGASATGLTAATSSTFNVTAGGASKLAFTVQPSNVAAGSSITPAIQVAIEDTNGNVVTSATNQITVSIGTNPSSGTLSGTAQVNAVAGVATFSTLNINKSGTGYTLGASATGLTAATSSAFNVTPGAAAALFFTVQPSNVAAGSSITPAVQVSIKDSQGNLVTTATNQITIAIVTNPSSGTLGGTAQVNAVAGVATFSTLSINNAGPGYTFGASATGLTSTTSTAFNVTAGVAAKLAFAVQPSNVAAGSSIAPAVQVSIEDAQGNLVTTATNQVTMSIGTNPSSGSLGGTAQVNAVAGVATFSTLNINKVGTGYTLGASATGLTGATSSAFNVAAGGASKLAFTVQPSSVVAGASISPAVQVSVEDANGNLVTTATNQITIAIGTNPSSGSLSGTAQVNAVAGVASFSTLSINKSGTGYALGASATSLTSGTSSSFNVTATTATALAFTMQPSNASAGSSITPAVQVAIEDGFGNVVTTATNQITIAIQTNPSSGTLSGTAQLNAVAGVATFSTLNINLTGTGYTLAASAPGLTGATSSAFNVTPNCTTNCSITGTVTGAWVSGVTITLSGGPSSPAPAVTNAGGNYSFAGLTQGTYTITPSLLGYSYTPTAPSVSIGASTVQNFVATSALTSFSISGTVSYAGSKTGTTIIRVFPANCTGCGVVAGMSLPAAPSSSGTSYIIRGLPSTGGGNGYVVQAEIDTLGTGIANESDPEGTSSTVTLPSANATGINFTVVDRSPSAPVTPQQNKFSVAPGNQGAVIQYRAPTDGNGEEIATSYNIYYGTDTNATNGVGSPQNFKAQGNNINVFILGEAHPLTNGSTYYFKITAKNTTESAATTPVSALIGPVSGGGTNSVSGTVTFPGTASGPMYVGVYGNNGVFTDVIQSPTTGQAYTITGVPAGTYQNFAIIDNNKDGEIGIGDITDITAHSNPPTITVSGNVSGANLALTSFTAAPTVSTFVQGTSGQPNNYSLSTQVSGETKLPVSMTLFSGKNVAVPFDMTADQHNANFNPIYTNSVSPTVGDNYQFLVTFSDGTSSVISAPITAVLSSSFPQNLTMNSPVAGSATVPVLNWTAPSTTPSFTPYTYNVGLANANGTPQENWNYYGNGNSNGIPSSQTNVTFDTDGSANPSSSLAPGGSYTWWVTVQDNDNNSAQYSTIYTLASVGPAAKIVFTQQPGNASAGATIPSVQVTVEDASGNTITSSNASITMAIANNPGSGTLSGTTTLAASSGVATFTNLSINNLGTGYTLMATAGSFTATSNAFNVTTGCTTNCTISGNVSGPANSGVTIALSGGPTSKPNTSTDSSGNYSFTGLAGGTYTVTPSLAGYTFSPAAPQVVTSSSTTTQNFTETSTLTSFSISGTLTYAGSKTGRTYIRVYSNNCSGNCGAAAGTSLATAPTSGGTAYTVRGLQNGTYVVVAEVDTLNNGSPNASNPWGNSVNVTVSSSNFSGANVTLTDPTPPAPAAPAKVTVAPGNTFALVQYNNNDNGALEDSNHREIATSYKVYWDTNSGFTHGTFASFAAHGAHDNNYIVHNLSPGTYFFKVSALVGATEAASSTVSATLAAGTGAFTVSGAVTFPGAATGPLYVGVFSGSAIYGQEISVPYSSGVTYSITGVPAGNYQFFAIIDQNNNGLIEPGDITNVNNNQGGPPPLTVSGNVTNNNVALTSAASTISVTTSHQQFAGSNDSYNLNLGIAWGTERPVAMTLLSGPNVPLPWDMPVDPNNSENVNLPNSAVPLVGDTYQFQVTFSDASTQTIPGTVTAVLSSFAQSMTVQTTSPGSVTVPQFNWVTPASTPSPYTYQVGLYSTSGSASVNWNDSGGNNSNGLPSGTTSVLFNADNSANVSSLPTSTNYNWYVQVQDSNGNSSTETQTYAIP